PCYELECDGAATEVALAAAGHAELVADRVTETAALPAHAGPLRPDHPVDRPGRGRGGPVDRAAVGEMVEAPHAVGRRGLVGRGIAEEAGRSSEGHVLVEDGSADLVAAVGWRVVGGALGWRWRWRWRWRW